VLILCCSWGHCRTTVREFAVTLAVTILVSAAVSLSLTPMMCAKLLKHRKEVRRPFYEVTEDYYNRVIAFYGRTVKWVLKHQTATLLVTFGTLILTLVLYVIVPRDFPGAGYGRNSWNFGGADNISFDAMSQRQQQLAKVIFRIRMWRACLRLSGWMARIQLRTAAAFRLI